MEVALVKLILCLNRRYIDENNVSINRKTGLMKEIFGFNSSWIDKYFA